MFIRLHWWKEFRADGLQNYGDLMSLYLVKKLSKKIVFSTRSKSNKYLKKIIKPYYIVIGSVIGAASENAIIWGSGIISKDQIVNNAKFLAVRGPQTRKRLLELNYKVPEVYGDPAILLPNFIKDDVVKKYDIGIIPHFVDYQIVKKAIIEDSSIKVINLLTNSIEKTTKEILECKSIISSSLHGLIVGQAYGIESLWVKFSNNLSGDDIKFFDYYQSMKIDFKNVVEMDPKKLNKKQLTEALIDCKEVLLPNIVVLKDRQEGLIVSCPF